MTTDEELREVLDTYGLTEMKEAAIKHQNEIIAKLSQLELRYAVEFKEGQILVYDYHSPTSAPTKIETSKKLEAIDLAEEIVRNSHTLPSILEKEMKIEGNIVYTNDRADHLLKLFNKK